MTATHLTDQALDRFARGDLDERDLLEVLGHLDRCEPCARAGQERAARGLASLRGEFSAEPPVAPRRGMAWALAAAAVLALVIVSAIVFRPHPPAQNPSSPIVRQPAPPPASPPPPATATAVASAYADPEWQQLVDRARASGRLPRSADLDALRVPADVLRGDAGAVERVEPSGVVIDDVRPLFTWPKAEGGTYVVFVFRDEREVMRSPTLEAPRWTPDRDLPRGEVLTWQVEWTRDGVIRTIPRPPSPPALFRIAGEEQHRELGRALQTHPGDQLLHAVLYARIGMRDEALTLLRRAAAKDPAAKQILDHETPTPH